MWNPKIINTDDVLYMAIADAIERDIKNGTIKINEKMPPQRLLAERIGVNLTTISRAYKEAHRRGFLTAVVGRGTYAIKPDKKSSSVTQIMNGEDIIELGLVGSIKVEGYGFSKLIKSFKSCENLDYLLEYVPSQGDIKHRVIASKWIKRHGMNVDAESVVICSGAIHAINCSLMGLFDPGDRIAVEFLTFTGFKNSAKSSNMKLEPIDMDDEGMLPESLEIACKRLNIKGIYLMPRMQNPTSAVMSEKRKKDIADIILKYNLILIEDDTYGFSNFNNGFPLTHFAPGNGIFISSMSKAVFPGLRVSFAVVPERFIYRFVQAVTNTVWMTSPISAEIACNLIETGDVYDIIEKKRAIISKRILIAKEILKEFSFKIAENGMFIWLQLPEEWTAVDFENIALMNKIRIIPSYKFYVGNQNPPNAIRISLGWVKNEEELLRGLKGVVGILKKCPNFRMAIM